MVWGTYRFRKHTTLQNGKNGPKKSAPECPVECGVQSLFGQCPNVGGDNFYGCSLSRAPMPLQILLLIPLPHTDINRNTQGTSDMLLRGVQAPHMCTRHMLLGTPLRFLIIVMMPMFSSSHASAAFSLRYLLQRGFEVNISWKRNHRS